MAECISRPVSWLVLERYVLDELPGQRKAEVAAHLDECDVCRGCAASIQTSAVVLPVLDVRPAAWPWWRRPLVVGGFTTLVAATAVMLLLLARTDNQPGHKRVAQQFPDQRVAIKGGELAMALIGERAGVTRRDPTGYKDRDRFKVLVTCPPAIVTKHVDVVVAQDKQLFYPLASQRIYCGNKVVLDGAFRVTGTTAITICVVVSGSSAIDRRAFDLARLRRSKRAVCQTLTPGK